MSNKLYWHFAPDDMRLGNGDSRKIIVGETLKVDGIIKMCETGLHASSGILDVLVYASGSQICRVRLSGEIYHESDKSVARERTVLWHIDGKELLRKFARWCALQLIDPHDTPNALIKYLKTGDEHFAEIALDATDSCNILKWPIYWLTRDKALLSIWESQRSLWSVIPTENVYKKWEKILLGMVYREKEKLS